MLKPEIKKPSLIIGRPGALLAVVLVCLLACANANLLDGVLAQETQNAGEKSVATITVTASFADKKQVAPDEQIELRLNRAPNSSEGRVAVVINQTDISNLFTLLETTLRYNPQLLPLPLGESEMTIYLVSSKDQWKEIARFTLNVSNEKPAEPEKPKAEDNKQTETKPEQKTEETKQPGDPQKAEDAKPQAEVKKQDEPATQQPNAEQKTDEPKTDEQKTDAPQASETAQASEAAQQEKPAQKRFGFEKLDFVPSIAFNIKSQPAQSNFPEANRPERPTFTDLNMQASIKSDVARGPFNSQTQFDFVGASFQKEALRFGELGDRAPQVDLSSYLMQFQSGKMKYQSGQYSYGTLRHLMSGFSSRGMMMSFPVGKSGDFSLTAMNGSTVVGFGNFFGLDKRKHQLLSGTLGYELLSKRPGGLRVEAGVLDGWLLPVTGFTEGAINDAQRSQGLGFRLIASDPKQRYKFEGGFTRSKFLNPADPLLNQNANVREVPPITRNARYLDASAEIFKDIPVTKEKKFNLTFTFKHELVDPLFRSLGASTQADKAQNDFSLVSAIGDVTAQFTHTRFNDNLANIPSILTSLNRANTLLIGVPTAALFSDPQKPSPLFPRVSYNFNRTHAFSATIPVNGGFEQDPTSIPDQLSTNQGLTADWQIQKWRLGYKLNHSFINNQQLGSELADQLTLVNGVVVGVSPNGSIDLNLDVSLESVNNKADRTIDRKLALTPTINWKMSKKATFASNFSTTLADDRAKTKRDRNITFDMQWTYQFAFFENDKFRKLTGQFFIRYADTFIRNRNFVLITDDLQKTRTLNLGLSFNIF
ncbi:MAG TPA: cell envelope integrity protein TolA [Blastocatellia bacterium]|nr:cell envelope integrity protein TolA [Blastocatellia bacterium]